MLDGDFLNYKSAIPNVTKTVAKVKTLDFLESIDRTSLILADRLKSPIKCVFANNEICLSSNASIGTSNDKISVELEGDDCTIGFNNKYMIDVLRVCDCDEVRIMLSGPVSPILLFPMKEKASYSLSFP